jgi:Helix-turn-helix domain
MSIEAVTWAKCAHVGNADEKHTLLLLADYHSAKTGECFPSQEALAADSERSIDTIQRHLKSLTAKGLINRHRRYRDGYRTSDGYTLAIKGELKPQFCGVSSKMLKPQLCGVSHGDLTPQNEKLIPQNPDLTPQNTPTLNRTFAVYKDEREEREDIEREELEPAAATATALSLLPTDVIVAELVDPIETEFNEQFWPRCPKKHGRKDALKAFIKARKRVTLEQIMRGLDTYIRTKEDWRHWKDPAAWLNGERWNDEPPPRSRSKVVEAFDQIIAAAANGLELPPRPL